MSFVYIAEYQHKRGVNLQEVGVTEKKIGKCECIIKREKSLNSTMGSIHTTIIAAWKPYAGQTNKDIERALHTLFKDNKIRGEWYDDDDGDLVERITETMKLLKIGKEVKI